MEKKVITAPGLPKPLGVYSQAVKVRANQFLFVSGTTARDEQGNIVGKGDPRAQTRQVLENIKKILDEAGGTFESIVKVTVFITDMRHFREIHEVRAEYFKKDFPASALVQVSALASPDLLIEMEAVAVLN